MSDILRKGFDECAELVNPLIANRARMAGEPIRIVGTRGGRLVDADGLEYEDFHGTQLFGHRPPAVGEAIRTWLEDSHPTWYPSRVSPWAGRFAKRLCERTGYSNVYFGMSGADAVEAALKLARVATRRPRILGLRGGYHGCSMGAVALMEKGPFHDPFGPHVPLVDQLPFADVDALARAFAGGDVGGVIVEPVQGEAGVRVLPDEYVAALCELTERHGALLVADEVQTGLGRTGKGFLRTELWPRRPDAVLLAKALGGGLVPVSAMLTRREIFERAYGRDFEDGESHNTTFSYNSLGMVAGLAALDVLTDDLVARVARVGATFRAELERALRGNPLVEEIRGEGLMLGVKLKDPQVPWLSFEHFGFGELAAEGRSVISPVLCHRLYRHGFFCFTCGHDWSVFRLQPRYEIAEETLSRFADLLRAELDALAEVAL